MLADPVAAVLRRPVTLIMPVSADTPDVMLPAC